MTMTDRFTLNISSRPENLSRLAEFIAEVAANIGLTDKEAYYIQMAVDEAVTNIIEHAYSGGEGPIEVIAERRGDDLIVTLRDQGNPFDPANIPEPALDAPLEEREPGGLGLYFMRKLMDDVTFRFNVDGWNELTMVRRRKVVSSEVSRYNPAVSIIYPRGRVDAGSTQRLENEIDQLAANDRHRLVIDFSQVSYISSSGLRVLLVALKRAKRQGGDVKLCNLSPAVHKIVRMAGFDRILEIHATEAAAAAAFA
jgi:anti-anti-sigma factor